MPSFYKKLWCTESWLFVVNLHCILYDANISFCMQAEVADAFSPVAPRTKRPYAALGSLRHAHAKRQHLLRDFQEGLCCSW